MRTSMAWFSAVCILYISLQGGPKSKPLPNYQNIALNRIYIFIFYLFTFTYCTMHTKRLVLAMKSEGSLAQMRTRSNLSDQISEGVRIPVAPLWIRLCPHSLRGFYTTVRRRGLSALWTYETPAACVFALSSSPSFRFTFMTDRRLYRMAQKSKPLPNNQQNRIKSH